MIGVGPGLLVSDAMMMDIEPKDQRERMMQALDVILRLLRGEEVTERTEWYSLNKAKTHLLPYQYPHPEVAVASAVTPSGGRAAGTYDLGMLCVAATETAGFDALAQNWAIAQDFAGKQGRTMDPARLRLVCPVHIAETREEARDNIRQGLIKWLDYYNLVAPKGLMGVEGEDAVDILLRSNRAVVGTPDDAIDMIERLHEKQGDFGVFLQQAHNWASWEKTKRSYELYARFVMPHLRDANRHRQQTMEWMRDQFDDFAARRQKGVDAMFAKHAAELRDKAS
jgi:limonene 1,2-monooxygenase